MILFKLSERYVQQSNRYLDAFEKHIVLQQVHAESVRDILNDLRSITGNINYLDCSKAPCNSTIAYVNVHGIY